MCKSKFIKIRIMVNPRQKCTMCWPNIPTPNKLKRDHNTYQCKGSVKGGGGGRAWCGDLTFFKNLSWNSLPTSKSFQSNAQKFPSADKFYQVAMVREKWKFFKVREKSGNFLKSQGTLFSDAMHQGWQWTFKDKIKPLWTFSTW